jgi:hypothetical protein
MADPSKTTLQVFISSTVLDLPEHRAAAVDACLRVGVAPVVMEAFGATETDLLAQSKAILDRSDVYIGILAFRYGFVPPGQTKSLTELEYRRAEELGIPRLVFLMSDDHPVRVADVDTGSSATQLKAFKAEVQSASRVATFRSADELKAGIVTSLVEILRSATQRRTPPTAFLLLPFSERHEPLKTFLSGELQREGVRLFRLDFMEPGASLANAVTDAIRSADFVIADVTDASPNVMYELGYVHALRKPTIMLADSEAVMSVPSDLIGYQLLTYDKEDLGSLRSPLARFIQEYAKEGRR